MLKILRKIDEYPDRTFFFQTKNTRFFFDYTFPDNVILGVTLETHIDEGYSDISLAPYPSIRARDFYLVKHNRKIITIEPILRFNIEFFVKIIKIINPERVYIGYDTKKTHLIEPSLKKTLKLCEELSKFTEVKTKLMREKNVQY